MIRVPQRMASVLSYTRKHPAPGLDAHFAEITASLSASFPAEDTDRDLTATKKIKIVDVKEENTMASANVHGINRRFSASELSELRNCIPIDSLIEKKLMIPSKVSEGFFRFLCPRCNSFRTATNPKTNLARCFRCEKNFNTIDMVMICEDMSFVESVKYLKAYQKTISTTHPTNSIERLQQILTKIGSSV
jgi:hypothetical protein